MHFPGNIFSTTLIISGIANLWLSWRIFVLLKGTIRWFAFIVLGVAIWVIAYGIELSCDQLQAMLICTNIEYIGIATLPAFWIVFVFKFIGKNTWLTKNNVTLLFAVPVFTLFFKWTGLWHLQYANTSVDYNCPFPMLDITPGSWYWVNTAFFYGMLAWALFLIITRFKNAAGIYKRQNNIILIGAFIPWLINLLYVLNIRPFKHLDLTPFGFMCSTLIIGLGFLRFRLFDILPVAREKIVEALQEGILVADAYNRLVDVNPKMNYILNKSSNQLIGKYLNDVFADIEELKGFDGKREIKPFEINKKELNEERYYMVTASKLFENTTFYSGIILLFKDITEAKLNEKKLKELNQLKDRLFSVIAHDLRSPLLSLMDIINLAGEGMVNEEEFRSVLPNLAKNIGYTSGLLDNLLIWSKSQLSGLLVNPVNFNINQSIQYVTGLFQYMAAEKGVVLTNAVTKTTTVFADEDMVQAVIRNLVANAIKFCRDGDRVTISSIFNEADVVIKVEDSGVGISAENQLKLFGLQNFTTRGTTNEQGTGLGLVLCKDFIEKNNGKIWVESIQGKGSSFYFTLPKEYILAI